MVPCLFLLISHLAPQALWGQWYERAPEKKRSGLHLRLKWHLYNVSHWFSLTVWASPAILKNVCSATEHWVCRQLERVTNLELVNFSLYICAHPSIQRVFADKYYTSPRNLNMSLPRAYIWMGGDKRGCKDTDCSWLLTWLGKLSLSQGEGHPQDWTCLPVNCLLCLWSPVWERHCKKPGHAISWGVLWGWVLFLASNKRLHPKMIRQDRGKMEWSIWSFDWSSIAP